MLRNLLILILITVGLALVRWLVKDVVRAVTQALGLSGNSPAEAKNRESGPSSATTAGHMVRDPVSEPISTRSWLSAKSSTARHSISNQGKPGTPT